MADAPQLLSSPSQWHNVLFDRRQVGKHRARYTLAGGSNPTVSFNGGQTEVEQNREAKICFG